MPHKYRPFRAFTSDTGGATAIFFALLLIPICGVIGLAVDYTRSFHAQKRLQNAADAAVLYARAASGRSLEDMRAAALSAFRENAGDLGDVEVREQDIALSLQGEELLIQVNANMPTTFAAVLGFDSLAINVTSGSVSATPELELALVLDNTGSMAPHMNELRQGANDLVDLLFSRSAASRLKFAVVPYVGTVNIGNSPAQRAFMDVTGEAAWHAAGLETKGMGYESGCISPPGDPTDPGTGTQGSLFDLMPSFAGLFDGVFATPALAATRGDVPNPFGFSPPCTMLSPNDLNTFDLLDQIPNADWRGCVEARAEPYDVTDDPPSVLNPNTLFVPWFWPDEADAGPMSAALPGFVTQNDYLPDRLDLRNAIAPIFNDPHPGWGWANTLKYNGTAANIDEVAPDTTGPNKACPDPILPLTDDRAQITAKINGLMHWNGSGTNVAEGLAWGWRVLSPGEPFTEGAAYGRANKVIVLMTDGVNNIDPHPLAPVLSHYSAYGFLEQWGESRLADKTFAGFKAHTDSRLAAVCNNAKAQGITIYTVAFGINDETTLAMLRDCASEPPMAYTATTAGDLVTAFRDVATRLSQLRLSR